MEYLKEFQAFAGRFSAAAEEKLTSVDGGTYNEYIRLYSQPWSAKVGSMFVCCLRQLTSSVGCSSAI